MDYTAFWAGKFSQQDPLHSWKAGPGEVMTDEKLSIYSFTRRELNQQLKLLKLLCNMMSLKYSETPWFDHNTTSLFASQQLMPIYLVPATYVHATDCILFMSTRTIQNVLALSLIWISPKVLFIPLVLSFRRLRFMEVGFIRIKTNKPYLDSSSDDGRACWIVK